MRAAPSSAMKLTVQRALVQLFFDSGIAEVSSKLQAVDAHHGSGGKGETSAKRLMRVARAKLESRRAARHGTRDLVHLFPADLPARPFGQALKTESNRAQSRLLSDSRLRHWP